MSLDGFVLFRSVTRRAEDCALPFPLPLVTSHPALPGRGHPTGPPASLALRGLPLRKPPSPVTFADAVLMNFPLLWASLSVSSMSSSLSLCFSVASTSLTSFPFSFFVFFCSVDSLGDRSGFNHFLDL